MKTTLVTGANRGIGLEHVRQALMAGEAVIATCREPARQGELASLKARYGDRLRIEALDVSDGGSVEALARRLDGVAIDLLINNAGVYGGSWENEHDRRRQTIDGMDYALWEEIFRANVLGAFRVTTALLPNVDAGRDRTVVMMSSDLGSIANNAQGMSHAYRSSKAALNMLTKGLSIDLAPRGITVVSLAPGWTRTELGGADAEWAVNDSVAAQRQVIAGLTLKESGTFVDLLGRRVPW